MGKIKFTIITICFNASDCIRKTIESVLNQTYVDFEYLIIDGASTDGTIGMIKEYLSDSRIRFYSEPDSGIYNAMNKGITRAQGKYVNFLNAGDCYFDENVLRQVSEYADKYENTILYGNYVLDMPDATKVFCDYDVSAGSLKEKAFQGKMPSHQAIFAPQHFLKDHYFKESFRITADCEWFAYCVSRNAVFTKLPFTICYFDKTGISSQAEFHKLNTEETLRVIAEYSGVSSKEGENYEEIETKNIGVYRENALRSGSLFQLMNQWVLLRQKGITLVSYFQQKNYRKIAIYGMSHVGYRLLDELADSEIEVSYAIDRNAANIACSIPVKSPNEELDNVDAIIVTAITFYGEIKENLSVKMNCPIISLENIIRQQSRR